MDSQVSEGFKAAISWYAEDKLHLFPVEFVFETTTVNDLDRFTVDDFDSAKYTVADIPKLRNDLKSGILNKRITKWLQRRIIPKNREFVEKILKIHGLHPIM